MPVVCIYFEATDLAARCHQFHERLRLEHGFHEKPSLPPHITIKAPFEIPSLALSLLRDRMQYVVRRQRIYPFEVHVGMPSFFDLQDSSDKALYLPVRSARLSGVLDLLYELFEEEFSLQREVLERQSPHITLVRSLPKSEVPGVLTMAGVLDWPELLVLRHISIDCKQGRSHQWRPCERVIFSV